MCNGNLVLRIMQDSTLAGDLSQKASPDSRGRGNKEIGYWQCKRHCHIQNNTIFHPSPFKLCSTSAFSWVDLKRETEAKDVKLTVVTLSVACMPLSSIPGSQAHLWSPTWSSRKNKWTNKLQSKLVYWQWKRSQLAIFSKGAHFSCCKMASSYCVFCSLWVMKFDEDLATQHYKR